MAAPTYDDALRRLSALIPSEWPTVAMNSPAKTNEIDSPAASAAGPNLCFDAAAPTTIGSMGSTHGESTDNTPAMKARTKLPVTIVKPQRVLLSNAAIEF